MTDLDDGSERELARLLTATDGLRARPGFNARVLAALGRERMPGFIELALSSSRRALPFAILAAALATVWAVQTDRSVDDELATSVGSLELE
ncbi:MAG TPA: hypothetical protein VGI10_16455 [Polyangiaceae bacterium]